MIKHAKQANKKCQNVQYKNCIIQYIKNLKYLFLLSTRFSILSVKQSCKMYLYNVME